VAHARGQLLADEAALVEIDAVEFDEAVLQQERLVGLEIAGARGHAEVETMAVVVGEGGRFGKVGERRLDLARFTDDPAAERGEAWIDDVDLGTRHRAGVAVEQRVDRDIVALGEADVGAQAVEHEPADEVVEARGFDVEPERVAVGEHQEIEQVLALRRQQRGVERGRLGQLVQVVADQTLQQLRRIATADLQHAAVAQSRPARHRVPSVVARHRIGGRSKARREGPHASSKSGGSSSRLRMVASGSPGRRSTG